MVLWRLKEGLKYDSISETPKLKDDWWIFLRFLIASTCPEEIKYLMEKGGGGGGNRVKRNIILIIENFIKKNNRKDN